LFAALYLVISGMASMKKKNVGTTFGILGFFVVAAMIENHILDYNYMFLVRHDGTPYQIFYNLVGGHPVLYPMIVVLLFVIYIIVFNLIYNAIKSKNVKEKSAEEEKAVANV
jgi:uncharacterized membrane protein YwaF